MTRTISFAASMGAAMRAAMGAARRAGTEVPSAAFRRVRRCIGYSAFAGSGSAGWGVGAPSWPIISGDKCRRAIAARTRSAIRRGRSLGHCVTADGETPTSRATALIVPPNILIACVFFMATDISTLTADGKPANRVSWLNLRVPSLKERLEEVMDAMQWLHADLVRVSEQSSSVVSQWLGKGSKEIKSIGAMEAAEKIESASGYSALWVAKGTGPKMTDTGRFVARQPLASYGLAVETDGDPIPAFAFTEEELADFRAAQAVLTESEWAQIRARFETVQRHFRGGDQ